MSESVEESIILTLFDLVSHMTQRGEEMAAEVDLTVRQWNVLLQAAGDPNFPPSEDGARGPVCVSDLAVARGVSKATISALVSALVRKGMLAAVEDSRDRRRKYLQITDRGRVALARIEPTRRRANRALLAPWATTELAALLEVLRGCLERLTLAAKRSQQEAGDAPG